MCENLVLCYTLGLNSVKSNFHAVVFLGGVSINYTQAKNAFLVVNSPYVGQSDDIID